MPSVLVNQVVFDNSEAVSFICGPCAIESYDLAMQTAQVIKEIAQRQTVGMVYKSSFDKANRTSVKSNRGLGLDQGLKILEAVRQEFNLPILTDIHSADQISAVASVVDVLQIPAFLCRQTDFVLQAVNTGKVVNIKKGQFLSPEEMKEVAIKATSTGNNKILLTERGVTFGYNNLVSDMRGLRIMSETGLPVIFDATHSVQMPGAAGSASSGRREFVEPLARAAAAVGVAGFFIETHPNPEKAISDGPNMIPLADLERLVETLKIIDQVGKSQEYLEIK